MFQNFDIYIPKIHSSIELMSTSLDEIFLNACMKKFKNIFTKI